MTLTRRPRPAVAFVCSLLLVAATLPLSPTSEVRAFTPTSSRLWWLNETRSWSHETITRVAFDELVRELDTSLPTQLGFYKASVRRALTEISGANVRVDDNQFLAALHFDGESFPEGQRRLSILRHAIIDALARNDYRGARLSLGSALHTVQDFYAHSNYIETNLRCDPLVPLICVNPGLHTPPHPNLGRDVPLGRLPATTPTCRNCVPGELPVTPQPDSCLTFCLSNITVGELTSGYYGGEDRVKPEGKCSHGGPTDTSPGSPLTGINKDTMSCDLSPHWQLHLTAAQVAARASTQYMRDILAAVGPEKFKAMLGMGVAPAFGVVVDVSDSMIPHLARVRTAVLDLVNARSGENLYALVPVRSGSAPSPTFTTSAFLFNVAFLALQPAAAAVPAQPIYAGMKKALGGMTGGGQLFVAVASGASDPELAAEVEGLARGKGVSVTFAYWAPPGVGNPSADPDFLRIAASTGGEVFAFESAEGVDLLHLLDSVARPERVELLTARGSTANGPRTYVVPVDTNIANLSFSVIGAQLSVVRPDGFHLIRGFSIPGISRYTRLNSGGEVYTVTNPPDGQWSITVFGPPGNFSLKVSGDSVLDLTAFTFVRRFGQEVHGGLIPSDGMPVVGQESAVSAQVSGDFRSPQFELRDEDGGLLMALPMSPPTETASEYTGRFITPSVPFRVYVNGLDANGFNVQRVLSSPIRPQTVKIEAPASQELQRGRVSTYTFKVTNFGPPRDFNVGGTDDMDYVTNVSPTAFSLGTNQSRDVTVRLQPPADTEVGTSDSLTLNVAGTAGAFNFTTVDSRVVLPNDPPDLSAVHPSTALLWPANHLTSEVSILGVTDPDGDAVTIQIEGITSDEATDGQGDGDLCPDASGIGLATAQLRAERSGTGDGRVYTVAFVASDGKGASSRGTVKVCVPHNSGRDCVDSGGPNFDAASCPAAPPPPPTPKPPKLRQPKPAPPPPKPVRKKEVLR